jgi:hypothetical protein
LLFVGLLGLVAYQASTSRAQKPSKSQVKEFVQGAVELKSVGPIVFGANGVLFVADAGAGAVYAVRTGDTKPVASSHVKVEKVDALLAARVGATAQDVRLVDMAVNPVSGKSYFSVAKKDASLILSVDAAGKVEELSLKDAAFAKVSLPVKETAKLTAITDMEIASDRVIVAAQSNEEFASKLYSIALPFTHNSQAMVSSTETYHISHRKVETRAPISTLTVFNDGKQENVVGAFACTPVVKYPVNKLEPEGVVKGISVAELGSRNRPLDMLVYKKNGEEFLLVNNNNHGMLKVAGKVLKENDRINENAALHRIRENNVFPAMDGIEEIKSLNGVVQMDRLSETHLMVLRLVDGSLTLESVPLP